MLGYSVDETITMYNKALINAGIRPVNIQVLGNYDVNIVIAPQDQELFDNIMMLPYRVKDGQHHILTPCQHAYSMYRAILDKAV